MPGFDIAVGIEGRAQRGLRGEVDGGEHQRHQVALLQPDAVLAAQHTTGCHRRLDDLRASGVDPIHHAGLAPVEHQQRVKVAVAGVEHVEHVEVVAGGDLVHLGEHRGSSRRGTTVSWR